MLYCTPCCILLYMCVWCVCDLFWVAWRKRKRASFLNNKCNNTTKHTRSHTYPEWNQIKQQLLRFLVHATIKKKKYTRPMYMWMWCLFSVYSCLCVVLCVFLFILWHCKLKASNNREKKPDIFNKQQYGKLFTILRASNRVTKDKLCTKLAPVFHFACEC